MNKKLNRYRYSWTVNRYHLPVILVFLSAIQSSIWLLLFHLTGDPHPVVRWHREDGEDICIRAPNGERLRCKSIQFISKQLLHCQFHKYVSFILNLPIWPTSQSLLRNQPSCRQWPLQSGIISPPSTRSINHQFRQMLISRLFTIYSYAITVLHSLSWYRQVHRSLHLPPFLRLISTIFTR